MTSANLPAQRQADPHHAIAAVFSEASDRLAAALPASLPPERMAQLVSVVAFRTPNLRLCVPESIVTCVIQLGRLDLDLTPGMNEAHLIPRKNRKTQSYECTLQLGYKGLEKLAIRTGTVRYIQPREVYEADEFEVWHEDDRTHFRHRPNLDPSSRGRVTHYYAAAKMADASALIEVMTAAEVEAIHQRTESYRYAMADGRAEEGPWATDYDAMARKTVIRKLTKSLPRVASNQNQAAAFDRLNEAIEIDNREFQAAIEPPPPPQNGSGYGRGQYASPQQTEQYLANLKSFLEQRNAAWLDHWQDKATGEFPKGFEKKTTRELINVHQADGHLLKWCVETGRLDPSIVPEEAKVRQLGRYTAIAYHRSTADRKAIGLELRRYVDEVTARKSEAVTSENPHLADPGSLDPEGCDPDDVTYPDEIGTNG